MLLPMFHFNGLPFKVSYFLACLWFISFIVRNNNNRFINREFKYFCFAISAIVVCSIIGELTFAIKWSAGNFEPFIRSTLIYILLTLSFGLGLNATRFNLKWLLYVLFSAIILNFAFIFLKSNMPTPLINLYYGDEVMKDLAGLGYDSAEAILQLVRPRGLFPNPNGSAFMVNIISLFLYLGFKNKLVDLPSTWVFLFIIVMPILLAMLLASRGEFIVALTLAFLHYKLIYTRHKNKNYAIKFHLIFIILFSMAFIYTTQKVDFTNLQSNINRVLGIIDIVKNSSSGDADVRALSGISRPLLTFYSAKERFLVSPLFGSGYRSASDNEYFVEGTDYYHNDWFRILVTSGILGFCIFLWIIRRYLLKLGWPVLIPFVLPGLVNTFLLNVPAVMFYFFMIGVLRYKLFIEPGFYHEI